MEYAPNILFRGVSDKGAYKKRPRRAKIICIPGHTIAFDIAITLLDQSENVYGSTSRTLNNLSILENLA